MIQPILPPQEMERFFQLSMEEQPFWFSIGIGFIGVLIAFLVFSYIRVWKQSSLKKKEGKEIE